MQLNVTIHFVIIIESALYHNITPFSRLNVPIHSPSSKLSTWRVLHTCSQGRATLICPSLSHFASMRAFALVATSAHTFPHSDLSRDDGSCCSTWARGSCSAKVDRVLWASRRAGIPARCCLSCCHTSSDEGAEGLRTRRSVVGVQVDRGLSLDQDNAVQATQGGCGEESGVVLVWRS